MSPIAHLLIAVAMDFGVVALGPTHADAQAPSIFVTNISPGYRDWKLISVSHEEGNLNSFAAILDNDLAIKAWRAGRIPFPDGTIIVEDSAKYSATGGWGFAHFIDGKPGDEALMKTCLPCHDQAKARDLVFTRYSP